MIERDILYLDRRNWKLSSNKGWFSSQPHYALGQLVSQWATKPQHWAHPQIGWINFKWICCKRFDSSVTLSSNLPVPSQIACVGESTISNSLTSERCSYERIEFYMRSTISAGCWMIAASCWGRKPDTTTCRKLEKTKKMTSAKLWPLRPTDLYVCICLVMAPTKIYIFMQQLRRVTYFQFYTFLIS